MRRVTIWAVAVAAVLALAACSDPPGGAGAEASPSDSKAGSPAPSETAPEVPPQVLSWWNTGSEVAAFDALASAFAARRPGLAFENLVFSGGTFDEGISFYATAHMADSFQVQAGARTGERVAEGIAADVTDLTERLGLAAAFPEAVLDEFSVGGALYAIPASVSRSNVLWGSTVALKAAGIDAADIEFDSPEAFFAVLSQIAKATPDVKPLVFVGDDGGELALFESALIAELGADGYNGLWDGTTDPKGTAVGRALARFEEYLDYAGPEDEWPDDWEAVGSMLVNGQAAFAIIGDSMIRYFEANGFTPGADNDWVWAPAPGSAGVFAMSASGFALATGTYRSEVTEDWLAAVASQAGQLGVARALGGPPARSDLDLAGLDPYRRTAARALATQPVIMSLADKTDGRFSALNEVMSSFASGSSDLAALRTAFAALFAPAPDPG
jgi:glucose/mannose transport system substrate-binding protein